MVNRADQQSTSQARIDSLDVLRGVAILGILVMNIQAFAMVSAAYVNPTVAGPMTGSDFWLWLVAHVGFENKFLSIFSALFGAGLVLMAERAGATRGGAWRRHGRRMGILALIGLAHAYLIWYGDILFVYALIGMLAFGFRHASVRRLLVAAAMLYLVPTVFALVMTVLLNAMPAADYQALADEVWQPSASAIASQEAAYRGGWLAQMPQRIEDAATAHLWLLPTELGWRVLALMLAGMAAYRSGLLTGAWHVRTYARTAAIGFGLGVPLALAGVAFNEATGWQMATSMYLGAELNALAAPLVALGWTGLALMVLQRGWLRGLAGRLRAVGRTALSSYLLTSVLCTVIFYGHGLGLFGQLDRLEQKLVMVLVWLVLLSVAPAWLRRFRMGPVEWLWRWGVYGDRPPLVRSSATANG